MQKQIKHKENPDPDIEDLDETSKDENAEVKPDRWTVDCKAYPLLAAIMKSDLSEPPLQCALLTRPIHPDAKDLFRDANSAALYPVCQNRKKTYITYNKFKERFPNRSLPYTDETAKRKENMSRKLVLFNDKQMYQKRICKSLSTHTAASVIWATGLLHIVEEGYQ